jgi:hypothetical protein
LANNSNKSNNSKNRYLSVIKRKQLETSVAPPIKLEKKRALILLK